MIEEKDKNFGPSPVKNESTKYTYQPLFETYDFDKLKQISKQVYISPINNWKLFCILKKRLETAFEIKNDLKYMMKELEIRQKSNNNLQRKKL